VKRAAIILLSGLALAAAAYAGTYFTTTAPTRAELCAPAPELAWLKQEFKLDDAQFAKISGLHVSYVAQCGERCRQIMSKNSALRDKIANSPTLTPEIEKEMSEIAQLRIDCQKEMFENSMAISREMSVEQGKRYLTWLLGQTMTCQMSNGACCAPTP
jgi:hypothetical protein